MKTYMQSAKALGTEIELRLVSQTQEDAEKWFSILWKKIFEFEKTFSRFKIESELNRLNLKAGQKVKVSDEFLALFKKAKYFFDLTEGKFNPFILSALQKAGYEKSMTGESEFIDFKHRKISDFSGVEIGQDWIKIPENSAIDFGGIGKGYLADILGEILDGNIDNYCLSLGGDMILKGKDQDENWKIEIASLKDEEKACGIFELKDQKKGIATSSILREKNFKTQYHIIDPQNGEVVKNVAYGMCTVVASDSVTADVLASCFLIMDQNQAQDYIDKNIVESVFFQGKEQTKIFGISLEKV